MPSGARAGICPCQVSGQPLTGKIWAKRRRRPKSFSFGHVISDGIIDRCKASLRFPQNWPKYTKSVRSPGCPTVSFAAKALVLQNTGHRGFVLTGTLSGWQQTERIRISPAKRSAGCGYCMPCQLARWQSVAHPPTALVLRKLTACRPRKRKDTAQRHPPATSAEHHKRVLPDHIS